MEAKSLPVELTLGGRLASLVEACEKVCVADCCGIDAFDFSPLHIASHMSATTGEIREVDINEIEGELDRLISEAATIKPTERGFVCSIKGMNQHFSASDLEQFVEKVKRHMRLAPEVLKFSNKLQNQND